MIMCRPEATFFLVMYVLYCVAMAFNSQFEAWAVKNLPVPDSWRSAGGHQGGCSIHSAGFLLSNLVLAWSATPLKKMESKMCSTVFAVW